MRRGVGDLVVDVDLGEHGPGEALVGRGHEQRGGGAAGPQHHGDGGRFEPVAQDLGLECGPAPQLDERGIEVGSIVGNASRGHRPVSVRKVTGTMAR